MYSPSVFFKDGLMLYVSESLKLTAKILFENLDWKCLKFRLPLGQFWPLRTLWCNLHMFLDIWKFKVENKNKFREHCIKNVVSDLWKKIDYVSTQLLLEKVQQNKTNNKNPLMRSQSLADSGDKNSSSCKFLIPHFQNSFPFFFFSSINSKMSRHMCKLHHKVRNGQILPPWKSKFRNFTDNLGHLGFKSLRLCSRVATPKVLPLCNCFTFIQANYTFHALVCVFS